jgi:GAF domain-containing protein
MDGQTEAQIEAEQHLAAIREVLRIISSSPGDLQQVLDAIVRFGADLCRADRAAVFQESNGYLRWSASVDPLGLPGDALPISRGSVTGRAYLERRTVHVEDIAPLLDTEYPDVRAAGRYNGQRTVLATPLLREAEPIGVLSLVRMAVQPFTDQQIALVETFANQAVIAIENARLFQELQDRNREQAEALEREQATASVLRVISRSPESLEVALQAVADTAVRLCRADFARVWLRDDEYFVAGPAAIPSGPDDYLPRGERLGPLPSLTGWSGAEAVRTGQTVHYEDMLRGAEEHGASAPMLELLAESIRHTGRRTALVVPLRRGDAVVGLLGLLRAGEPRPFSEREIALAETFADQAVIAVENTRLFDELEQRTRELTEALERQTATSEILQIISSSPANVAPVLAAVVERAARLCDAGDALIYRLEGGDLRLADQYGSIPVYIIQTIPIERNRVAGRAVLLRAVVQVHDIAGDEGRREYPAMWEAVHGFLRAYGYTIHTVLAAPLLRKGEPVGAILMRRTEVRPFTEQQIAILETFARQAAIAIENARLFEELQRRTEEVETRNAALTEALEHQRATSEVLELISRAPMQLQAVLDGICERAAALGGAESAFVRFVVEAYLRIAAFHNLGLGTGEDPLQIGPLSPSGAAVLERRTVYMVGNLEDWERAFPVSGAFMREAGLSGYTILAIPLQRENETLGTLTTYRYDAHGFSPAQIALQETFARQAVIAIENTRLFEEIQSKSQELAHSVEQLQALGSVGQAVSSQLDLETVLKTIVAHAQQLSAADVSAVYEFDEAADAFRLLLSNNMDIAVADELQSRPLRLGEGVAGRAGALRAPFQVADVLADPGAAPRLRPALAASGTRAILGVPMLREDQLLGVLVFSRNTPGEFAPEAVELLKTFASQSAIAIQNARLFREIEAQRQALEVASRHKSEFLANMSHELRTPLNAIIGYSEMLQEEADDLGHGDLLPDLNRIHTAAHHLLGLINDILDLSKVEAGRMDLYLEDFDIPTLIAEVEAVARPLMEKNVNTLVARCPPDLGTMRADQTKVRQALFNLLSNAAKFTEHGTITLTVQRDDPSPQPPPPGFAAERGSRGENRAQLPLSAAAGGGPSAGAEGGPRRPQRGSGGGVRSPSPWPTPASA